MDPTAGARFAAELRKDRGQLTAHDLDVLTTPKAGHYLFMDNPAAFLQQVAEVTGQYLPAEAKKRLVQAAKTAGAPLGAPFHPPDDLEEQVERIPTEFGQTT